MTVGSEAEDSCASLAKGKAKGAEAEGGSGTGLIPASSEAFFSLLMGRGGSGWGLSQVNPELGRWVPPSLTEPELRVEIIMRLHHQFLKSFSEIFSPTSFFNLAS